MSEASMSGRLPQGDANGLSPIIHDLVEQPHRLHAVIAVIDCKKTVTNNDTGEVVPQVRVRRVEAVLRDDLPQAEKLVRRAFEKRSGLEVLPLDLEDDLRAAFEGIDPRTGERLDGGDAK